MEISNSTKDRLLYSLVLLLQAVLSMTDMSNTSDNSREI